MASIAQTIDSPIAAVHARVPPHLAVVGCAAATAALGVGYLTNAYGWRHGALFVVGLAAGVVLYHAAFGFTSAWRTFITNRRGAAVRAQMLMLAATTLVFFPALGSGHLFGQAVRGSVSPVGVSVFVGAFLFGIGMQLGGGCASGTLYTAGGGNVRMLVTLASFIAGSVIGVAHLPWWEALPATKPISLIASLGMVPALLLTNALFLTIVGVTLLIERRGAVPPSKPRPRARMLAGPWPLAAGALGLAAVNVATLALAGRPWGVTSAFALWGSKIAAAFGVNVAAWPYWSTPARAAELNASVLRDVTSIMDFGILIGALAAAGLAGRFAPTWRVPIGSLTAAIVGGLLLGYGARIAYGCNIGAYFSGIASSSLHGWLWLIAAFAGNIAGTRLRPLFGLARTPA
jgi:uncharacterized membrane protein YedE/YeeE